MKATNLEEFYSKHLDLGSDNIGPEQLEDAVIVNGWYALELIGKAPEKVSSSNRGLIMSTTVSSRAPMLYRVLLAGEGCKFQPDDLVLVSHLAVNKIENSQLCFVPEDQVILKWGKGINR